MKAIKSGYVIHDGNPLNYLEWGDPLAPPLLMIAPIRHPAFVWRDVAEKLAAKYRVIGVNLRGHGDSGPFPVRRYDPDFYVDDLKAFVDQLGVTPAVVLGFSVVASGAAVGFAARYPELARAVILVDGGPGYRLENAQEADARVKRIPYYFDTWSDALDFYKGMPDQLFSTQEMREERAPYVFRYTPDGRVTWKHDHLLRELWPGEDWKRNTGAQGSEVWDQVQCPVFVMKSAATTHLSIENCEEIVQHGQGSAWVSVEGGKTHFVYDENQEGFCAIVEDFMGRL